MRGQVSRYPFFIESERGQVDLEPLLSVGDVFESQLRAIDVEERANDRAFLGGIEEVGGHPQRQIARAHRSEERRKNLLPSCLWRRRSRVFKLAITDAEKTGARAHSRTRAVDLDLDRMAALVEFFVLGIEPEQVIALLIVESLIDADVQIIGIYHGESACLPRQTVRPSSASCAVCSASECARALVRAPTSAPGSIGCNAFASIESMTTLERLACSTRFSRLRRTWLVLSSLFVRLLMRKPSESKITLFRPGKWRRLRTTKLVAPSVPVVKLVSWNSATLSAMACCSACCSACAASISSATLASANVGIMSRLSGFHTNFSMAV